MVNFQILTDALCDLPADWVAKRDCLTVVETPIIVTGRRHNLTLHDLAADDFSQVEYYIDQGDSVTTSQPHILDPDGTNPNSIESLTRKYVLGGKDVIYIVMNSELSGAYDTASALFSQLEDWATEQGRRITCVDSKCMSTGLALLLMELDEKIQSGKITNIAEIRDFVEKERGHIGHYFTWGELSYIQRSGRVDGVSAMFGTLLGIRPICSAQYGEDGETRKLEHVNPHAMIRGITKFGEVIGAYAKKHISNPNGPVIVAHGNVPHDAELVAKQIRKYLPDAVIYIGPEWRCGPGIQAHGGPTSIHVNFRTDDIGTLEDTRKNMQSIIRSLR